MKTDSAQPHSHERLDMANISSPIARSATRSMWNATWRDSLLTRTEHIFLDCLSHFLGADGLLRWTSIKVVKEQFERMIGRRCSTNWIDKLFMRTAEDGVIAREIHSAPGQPAVYRAVIPDHPGGRPVSIRRRGISPRRLLASFHREASDEQPQEAEAADRAGARRARTDSAGARQRIERFRADREGLAEGDPAGEPHRRIQARRDGRCARCAEPYRPGDWLARYPEGWGHVDCADAYLENQSAYQNAYQSANQLVKDGTS
jgi:hypothetical protein